MSTLAQLLREFHAKLGDRSFRFDADTCLVFGVPVAFRMAWVDHRAP